MATAFDSRKLFKVLRDLFRRMLRKRQHSFLHHVLRWKFLVSLAILLTISYEFSHIWIIRYAGLVGHDSLLGVAAPSVPNHCQIVTISEEEYDQLFGSCLPPENLSSLIKSLLRFEPAVLAIDIDTSAPRFRDLALPETKTRIVWARPSRHKGPALVPGAVLGNRATDPKYSGVALFPLDPDSTTRGFQRWVGFSSVSSPSFHWQILQAYCDSGSERACKVVNGAPGHDTSVRELDYHFRFPPIPASDVVSPLPGAQENILRTKVVILGGGDSDRHLTPFGVMSGAELTGAAIETEMEGREYKKLGDVDKFCLKVVLALIVALIFHFLKSPIALVATLGLLAATIVCTFFVYYYASLLIDFVPFVVGVWIEQLYDAAEQG